MKPILPRKGFPDLPDLRQSAALVTGASSGIGRASPSLLQQGMRVAGQMRTGRRPKARRRFGAELGSEEGCVEAGRPRPKPGQDGRLVHSAGISTTARSRSSAARLSRRCSGSIHFPPSTLVRELLPRGPTADGLHRQHRRAARRAGHSHYAASKGAMQSMVLRSRWRLRRGADQPRSRRAGCGRRWRRGAGTIGPALCRPPEPARRGGGRRGQRRAASSPPTPPRTHRPGHLRLRRRALFVVPRGQSDSCVKLSSASCGRGRRRRGATMPAAISARTIAGRPDPGPAGEMPGG